MFLLRCSRLIMRSGETPRRGKHRVLSNKLRSRWRLDLTLAPLRQKAGEGGYSTSSLTATPETSLQKQRVASRRTGSRSANRDVRHAFRRAHTWRTGPRRDGLGPLFKPAQTLFSITNAATAPDEMKISPGFSFLLTFRCVCSQRR